MKAKKKILSLLLAIAMILGMLPMTALPVYAAPPATPTNLTWDGNIAKWDSVDGATGYRVILRGSENPGAPSHNMYAISNETLNASETSRDYSDLLLPGMTYLFEVGTLKGEEYSDFVDSDKQTISGSIGTIAVTWGTGEDSKKASWSPVSGATGYDVWVKKDGVQSGVRKLSTPEIDLTETVNNEGNGTYSVNVKAYKGEAGNWMAIGQSEDKALQANAVATVADVSIFGTQGSPLTSQDITITLTNDTFVSSLSGNWITNLPAGLTQTLTRSSDIEAKITISGTPTATSSEVLEITIPAASLNGGKETTVKSNTNAKFNIMANTTIRKIDVTGITVPVVGETPVVNISSLSLPADANYTVWNIGWWKGPKPEGSWSSSTSFDNSSDYWVMITFNPKDDYSFAPKENIEATVNGNAATEVDDNGSKRNVWYNFGKAVGELTFTDSSAYDIPEGKAGTTIAEIDVSGGVSGGIPPYAFSKESGPTWLSVSADGKITGTRPSNAEGATTAVIKVTDNKAGTPNIKTIEIAVGAVAAVTSIAVNSTSHKTAYKVGETFDVTGLTIEATLSDSSTQTINVTSGMVSGFDSSAVAASQTLTITYDGKTTTYNISITKADGPAAPTGLVGVKPTTAGGTDGKITGTTALMEYADNSSFSSPTDCTGTEITGLSAGTYYVRVKATTTHEAGAYATVTVPAGSTATVTSIAVNSTSHKTAYKVGETFDVTGLTIEATLSDSSTQTINVTSGMVSGFDSSAVAASQTLTITYDGKTTTYNISITKADGPAAPTGLVGVKPTTAGGTDGKITGTTALMEYADNSSFSSPTDVTGTEITGLSAGTYYVRVKATTTHEAGAYATVTVPAGSTATYTVTISIGGTSATGSGSYTAGTTVNIYAGNRSGYTFTGWTSSDVTITGASSKNASFTMPAKNVTVTATWNYSGGGGSSGGTSAPQQTIPAADGAVQVNYTTSGGTASLSLPESKINDIIAKSKGDEELIDLSKVSGATAAELPKAALTAFGEAGLGLGIQLPAGSITLNQEAAADIAGQAEGGSLKLELKQVAKGSLTDEQKEAVKSNDLVLDINISSGTKKISSFDGTLSITVPYSGPQPVAVWYLNDKGELEKLFCTFVDGTVSFNLDHLSLYVVGQDTAWVNPFADVKESDWFYGSVEYAFKNGLMVGTSDTTFSPYMNTTRGMIVTILHRLEGRPKSDTANAFTDVGADKYYTDAVAWARDNIIVSGYGNGMFGPEDSITREQMAVILMNYAKYKGYDISMKADLSKFADEESISPWAKDAISWANAEGLIQGSGSQLMPVDNALRCQVAAILQRFLETIAK